MLSLALVSKNSNPEAKKEKHSLSFHTSAEINWDLVVVLSGDSGKGYGLCERWEVNRSTICANATILLHINHEHRVIEELVMFTLNSSLLIHLCYQQGWMNVWSGNIKNPQHCVCLCHPFFQPTPGPPCSLLEFFLELVLFGNFFLFPFQNLQKLLIFIFPLTWDSEDFMCMFFCKSDCQMPTQSNFTSSVSALMLLSEGLEGRLLVNSQYLTGHKVALENRWIHLPCDSASLGNFWVVLA